ncbi:hypothetical protein Hokovirus_2_56 [Hokovirus HKV1]|uniref:Uncharacterized protein n=1 Tax=Hokovirus HKV1 TaxID=1977638 RepID=A0A1V0SFM9_9VIRU|nr:hypothetical protein Hokovirus_2_56 [Hokovirus HKV1]
MSYFNYILPSTTEIIKTIILKDNDCLMVNTITKKLINSGYQVLPATLYPNEVHISYIDTNNTTSKNYSFVKPGNVAFCFMN